MWYALESKRYVLSAKTAFTCTYSPSHFVMSTLKCFQDIPSLNFCSKLFHNFGAAYLKECKPYLKVQVTFDCLALAELCAVNYHHPSHCPDNQDVH